MPKSAVQLWRFLALVLVATCWQGASMTPSAAAGSEPLHAQAQPRVAATDLLVANGDFRRGRSSWFPATKATRLRITSMGRTDGRAAELSRDSKGPVVLRTAPVVGGSERGDAYAGLAYFRALKRRIEGRLVVRELSRHGLTVNRTVRHLEAGKRWSKVAFSLVAKGDDSRFEIRVRAFGVGKKNRLIVDDISMRRVSTATPTQPPTTETEVSPPSVVSATPEPNAPASPRLVAGARPPGSLAYPVPGDAVYAIPANGTAGNGTLTSPYQSAQTAVAKAPSGATVVLRGGVYHESVRVPFNKRLVIQPYPNEAVWFDGAAPVTGWVKNGSTWAVDGWNHIFDKRVSFGQNKDESSWFVDPAFPMAGHPDQVWVGGVELVQVGSEGAVTTGKFFVDRTDKRLVIGTDPAGKLVEASRIQKAIQIHGAGTTVRGIGIRRYAPHLALFGAVSYEVDDLTLENVTVLDSATIGIGGWGDRATMRNITVKGSGLLGLHGDAAPGLLIADSLFERNNDERFREQPVSGGVKLTNSEGVRVVNSVFHRNTTYGLWFDVSMRSVTITGNRLTDNGGAGLLYELSADAIIADNYFARNGKAALFLFDSNNVKVWNNTLDKNHRSIQVLQDDRRNGHAALAARVPWVTSDIEVANNVITYGTNFCPVLTQHLSNKWYGSDFGISSDANVFHRATATDPSRFACWADGAAGTKSFDTLGAFSKHSGLETSSRLYEGSAIVTADGALTSQARTATTDVPRPLPADVAAEIGRAVGERSLGAYQVR